MPPFVKILRPLVIIIIIIIEFYYFWTYTHKAADSQQS